MSANEILLAVATAIGTLVVSGVSYLISRAWRPVEGIEKMRSDMARQEDRLAAGSGTFAELRKEMRGFNARLQQVELSLARLEGAAQIEGTGKHKVYVGNDTT